MALGLLAGGCGRKVIALGKILSESGGDAGSGDAGAVDAGATDARLRDAGAGKSEHPCTSDAQCIAFHEICITGKGQCGECVNATQCTRGAVCEPTTNECVQCVGDTDCATLPLPVCNPVSHTCTVPCTADACFLQGFGVCDNGYCAFCRDDAQCTPLAQLLPSISRCNHGQCTECVTNADCGGRYHCNSRGRCEP